MSPAPRANYKKWFHSKNRDERYDYLYPPEELAPIAASLKAMVKKVEQEPSRRQAKKIIAATNNHYKGQAAVNAIDLKRLLGVKDNPIPKTLREAYPQLALPTSWRSSNASAQTLPLSETVRVDAR